ncbi:MAG: PD-(D/E)XK nuclease family protein [Dehalococcoidia bacterium]
MTSPSTEATLFKLTHSKIQSFKQCRKKYWFSYVSGEEWPPSRETAPSLIGNGVHRAMQALTDTGNPADGEHELDTYLRMPKHAIAGPQTEHYGLAMEMYKNGIKAHESIVSEERFAELDTWVPARSRGINVRAKVDRADRLGPNQWQLIDWKTGRFDLDDTVDAQLDIAHLVLRTMLRLPKEANVRALGWNLRTGEQRVRELTRDDAVKTVNYLYGLARRLESLTEFPATPGPVCTFCDWRDRCEEADQLETVGVDWLDVDWEKESAPF